MSVFRHIGTSVRDMVKKYPVLAITGPRQSGKTTMLKKQFPDYRYVNLENPDVRSFAESDPNGFLSLYDSKVVFDEVQRVPHLFSYIQTVVDDSKQMGQFILSGSQNFHLMENITQSLAGRVALFKLFPFDFQEMQSANFLSNDYSVNIINGFYPAIYDRDIPSRTFYNNYIETYVQRDVSELISIRDMQLFKKFLVLCAARAGQLLKLNALANECGISQPTAKSWLSALESSYIVFQLQPYYENFSKRVIKTPKLYFYDTGLLAHLLKIRNVEQLASHSVKGNLFENMMIAEYIKRMYHSGSLQDLWFWRDSSGKEIDLYIDNGQEISIVEMKAGKTIMPDMFETLIWFEKLSRKNNLQKLLVYGGNENQKRSYGEVVSWLDFGKTIG